MSTSITFNLDDFNSQLRRLKEKSGRSGYSVVTFWARKLLRKLAYATPISHGTWATRGRARAGWWPAASALGVSNIYTPFGNMGEGFVIDARTVPDRPAITIGNTVPYITHLKVGLNPFEAAIANVEGQMKQELESEYRTALG